MFRGVERRGSLFFRVMEQNGERSVFRRFWVRLAGTTIFERFSGGVQERGSVRKARF